MSFFSITKPVSEYASSPFDSNVSLPDILDSDHKISFFFKRKRSAVIPILPPAMIATTIQGKDVGCSGVGLVGGNGFAVGRDDARGRPLRV